MADLTNVNLVSTIPAITAYSVTALGHIYSPIGGIQEVPSSVINPQTGGSITFDGPGKDYAAGKFPQYIIDHTVLT